MRRIMLAVTAVLVLTLSLATSAFASYNPPPTVSPCGGMHGAFGAFSGHFAAYGGVNWISADAISDKGMGHETGPANSAKSCQQHF